jgi:uncharacterized membrane protein
MNESLPSISAESDPTPRSLAVPLSISLGLGAVLMSWSCWIWQRLPVDARVPIHWNAAGKVDGYGGRNGLFLIPAAVLGLSLVFFLLPRIDPRRANLLRSSRAYSAVWLATVLFLAGLQIFVLRAAMGISGPMGQYLLIGAGACLAIVGNFLGKVRSNFFFGVRTPWTLSSELSWNKTHRLTGWVFVLFGSALAIAGALQVNGTYVRYMVYGFIPVLLWATLVYSYMVWRRDPRKASPSGLASGGE